MVDIENFEEECAIAQTVKVFKTLKQSMSYVDNAKENLWIYKNRIYDASHNLKGILDYPTKNKQ